eukprot:14892232-Ditylum_brightwellii.AAC.1
MGSLCTGIEWVFQGFSCPQQKPNAALDADELLDILEFGVLASWLREFTVQGFDPVDQGLRKFVEFYT